MASNDGQRLLVLGLTFRQHHTLHMQQVLRAYERLPANPMDRVALYTSLFELSKDLDEDETRNLEIWLRNGGQFPTPTPRTKQLSGEDAIIDLTEDDNQADGDDDWPEYHPEDFEAVDSEDGDGDGDSSTSSGEEREHVQIRRLREDDQESAEESDEDFVFEDRPVRPAPASKGKSAVECFECLICAESYTLTEFPSSTQITNACNHEEDQRVCIYCLQQSIETAVAEGQLNLVVCPFCPEKLSHNDVKKYATKEIFARYEYLVMIATPDMVMCLGLNCGSGQIHTGDDPMMVCETCYFKTCAVHKLPWHVGQTCEEFDMDESQIERLEEAEATAKLLAKEHAQVCPNCHQGVSRSEGCDHMTCRCGMEWCYVCGTSYEKVKRLGEEAHAPTCIYHPRRVQMRRDQEQAVQGQLTALVHGGPVSETLERARGQRNARIRAELRPLAAQAAERRMREMEKQQQEEKGTEKKRKLILYAPWEER